ncbi:MAG: dUTP diphosphatase [Gammaproteobacteria bacterium]|nr:MAG: dUTP diphosphatase [Gammaproteobacteria bacterium]
MKEKILAMLEMQDAMNSKVNPEWRNAGNAWYRAIWTECAEMLDHYGWKWWKHQQHDMDQVRLEIVDIWHFAMSDLLIKGESVGHVAEHIANDLVKPVDVPDIRTAIEMLALHTLESKSANVPFFAGLMRHADMTFDDLYRMYVGKNVLNFFRQDHGYKDGSYIKVWNNREDNECLADILSSLNPDSETFADDVYKNLEAAYPA